LNSTTGLKGISAADNKPHRLTTEPITAIPAAPTLPDQLPPHSAYSNYEHEEIGEVAGGYQRRKVPALIAGLQTSFDDPAVRSSMNSRSP
jgi:hypothetical protein